MTIQPPFRIAGGKRRLAPLITSHMRLPVRTYCEPFVGGGAVYLHARQTTSKLAERVILADACPATIQIWKAIQDSPDELANDMGSLLHHYAKCTPAARHEMYEHHRAAYNSGEKVIAASPLFLRATAFNGLWRVNKTGGMNTPWGKRTSFPIPDIAGLSKLVQGVSFPCWHWAFTLSKLEPEGLLVYVDPPYHGGFTSYTRNGFDDFNQRELIAKCATLASRGAQVIYSNAASELILDFLADYWPEATVHYIDAARTIAADPAARGTAKEVLVVS